MIVRKFMKWTVLSQLLDVVLVASTIMFLFIAYLFHSVAFALIAVGCILWYIYKFKTYIYKGKDLTWLAGHGVTSVKHFGKTLLVNGEYKTVVIKKIYEAPNDIEFVDALHGIIYVSKEKLTGK